MNSFTFNTTSSIRFGYGASADLASAFNLKAGNKVFIVTDPGIVKANLLQKILPSLQTAKIPTVIYDKVVADPSEQIVHDAIALARSSQIDAVIGVGGGSSLDVAKLVSLLTNGEEQLQDIYGVNRVRGERLRLALIPTTAGTGSEVSPIAVVTTGTSEKKGVSSPVLLPDLALLDPELTLGLPPIVTASTGIDAIVHAIEAYTSINANNGPLSKLLARQALSLLAGAIRTAVKNGSDLTARGQMLLGSMLAGQAFANSPVAAVHALAYPLGGHYHVPHGLSNALVLPHILRFNMETCNSSYTELAIVAFPHLADRPVSDRADAFINELVSLSKNVGIPQRLRDVGVNQSEITILAEDAMKQTRLLVNNPKSLALADAIDIYSKAW